MNGITAIILLAIAMQPPAFEPTPAERAAIHSRIAIRSGSITLRHEHLGSLGKPVTTPYEFQFDGANRFMNAVDEGGPELYSPTAPPQAIRHVLTPIHYMTHTQFVHPSGTRFPAYVDDLRLFKIIREGSPDRNEQSLDHVTPFDARLVGFTPASLGAWYRNHLDMFVCGPRNTDSKIESVILDGVNATQVTYLTAIECEIAIWICDERDHCPMRIDIKAPPDPDGSQLIDSMQAQLEEFDDADDKEDGRRWFPRKIVQSRTEVVGASKNVLEREQITVVTASFNQPIDETQFTLSALELPEKTLINHRPAHGIRPEDLNALTAAGQTVPADSPLTKWSENNEASLTEEDMAARRKHVALVDKPARNPWRKRLLWINLIVLGVGLLWYRGANSGNRMDQNL